MTDIFDIPQPILISTSLGEPSLDTIKIKFVTPQDTPSPDFPGKSAGDIFYKDSQRDLLVSTGSIEKLTPDTFRVVGGAITRWLIQRQIKESSIVIDDNSVLANNPENFSALLEGLYLGSFQFNRHKKVDDLTENLSIKVYCQDAVAIESQITHALVLTRAVNLARDWAHEPANVINPATLAERALALAARYQLPVKILNDHQLEDMGAGAIHAVGKGSATPSRLIVIEYPGQDLTAKPVVLVGKAITFDTGGYSLKSVENILNMKYDKCGGMAVLATLQAAAELKIKTPVIGIVAAAENMIAGHSYRPDDIIKSLSGKTIEIISTDAEGRLVLADALTYAQRSYEPRALIDLATLTGGVLVALGRVRAGLLSNCDQLAQQLFDAGQATHERLWRLPLDEDFAKLLKGDDADIKNSGGREAHCILGGMFLQNFVEDGTPWAHLDIAGMADSPKELPYSPKGATGFGVRLLVNYLESL